MISAALVRNTITSQPDCGVYWPTRTPRGAGTGPRNRAGVR